MIDKKLLKRIREQEMDRKEFLKYSGLALLGLVGIKGLIALLDPFDKPQYIIQKDVNAKQTKNGFGSGRYGA